MKKIKYPCFEKEIFHNEFITFYPLYSTTHTDIISADTETKLYYNGKLLTENEAYILFRDNGQLWAKENIVVDCYALTLSTGKGFALFQTVTDFLTACAMLNVKKVIWYNAKFDFSIFDYYFLTNDWKNTTERIKGKTKKQKLADKTYTSLDGEYGQRYQLQIWKSYKNRNSTDYVHKFKMIDLCNVIVGGLAKNLEAWDIKDEDGNKIRKLEMDYQTANFDNDEDMQYMINDVQGLYYLTQKVDATMKEITSFSFFDGDYLTAGGLSIKTFLYELYGKDNRTNKSIFRLNFPMTIDFDRFLRTKHLYLGGKCLINPSKRGVVQRNVFKYDVNSMYPFQMYNMRYPYGTARIRKEIRNNDKLKIVHLTNLVGNVKPDKIPIFQDFDTKEYDKTLWIEQPFLIWLEELQELEKWYDLTYEIIEVYEYDGLPCDGAKRFIDKFYKIKQNSTGNIKNGAKLILNSSYGKLAQRLDRPKGQYELAEAGYVHYVKHGIQVDKSGMLSVLVGSRVTALARVCLMQYIRKICNENVKDNFIYCDTDSVHALTEFTDTDDKALGKMKNEGVFKYAIYLAPKSYIMQDEKGEFEVHCKGVNTKVVKEAVKGKTIIEASKIFTANKTFKSLSGINCKGGKALIYIDKMILNDDEYRCDTSFLDDDDIIYEKE